MENYKLKENNEDFEENLEIRGRYILTIQFPPSN